MIGEACSGFCVVGSVELQVLDLVFEDLRVGGVVFV
jgi:hypothetical protein